MESFLLYEFGGLIFGGACTWRSLFLEFYGIVPQTGEEVGRKYVSSNSPILLACP